MKYLIIICLFVISLTSCNDDITYNPIEEELNISVSSNLVPIHKAPLTNADKQLVSSFFSGHNSIEYDRLSEKVIIENDMAISVAGIRAMIDSMSTGKIKRDRKEGFEKGFTVSSQWLTISRNNSQDVVIFVPDINAADFPRLNLPATRITEIRNLITAGILDWTTTPDCRLNIRVTNDPSVAFNTEVVWEENPSYAGRANFPEFGNAGDSVRFNLDYCIDKINDGDQIEVRALGAHEMGHALGIAHTNRPNQPRWFVCGSDVTPPGGLSVMNQGVEDGGIRDYDLNTLSTIYPATFVRPTVSSRYEFEQRHIDRGYHTISTTFTFPNQRSYPKAKIMFTDQTTGQITSSIINLCGPNNNTFTHTWYGLNQGNRLYDVAVQCLNWREDIGSSFGRKTIFVPGLN